MDLSSIPRRLSLLELNTVFFPGARMPVRVSSAPGTDALREGASQGFLVVARVRDPLRDPVRPRIGVVARVLEHATAEAATVAKLEGVVRCSLATVPDERPFVSFEPVFDLPTTHASHELAKRLRPVLLDYLTMFGMPAEMRTMFQDVKYEGQLADLAIANLPVSLDVMEAHLEDHDVDERLRRALACVEHFVGSAPAAASELPIGVPALSISQHRRAQGWWQRLFRK